MVLSEKSDEPKQQVSHPPPFSAPHFITKTACHTSLYCTRLTDLTLTFATTSEGKVGPNVNTALKEGKRTELYKKKSSTRWDGTKLSREKKSVTDVKKGC